MTTAEPRHPWDELRAHLVERDRELKARIHNYPAPITACDAQFNYLLEQRDLIRSELRRLDQVQHRIGQLRDAPAPAAATELAAFLDASSVIDPDIAQRLLG